MTAAEAQLIYRLVRGNFPLARLPEEIPQSWLSTLERMDYIKTRTHIERLLPRLTRPPASIAELVRGIHRDPEEHSFSCSLGCRDGLLVYWASTELDPAQPRLCAVICDHIKAPAVGEAVQTLGGSSAVILGRVSDTSYEKALATAQDRALRSAQSSLHLGSEG